MFDPGGLSEHAKRDAAELLPALGNRWLHVQAVAQRARELTPAVNVVDHELLVASAWLHDIGYAPGVAQTGFHPLDGARFLESRPYPRRLVCLVAHHSGATYEAAERGLDTDLSLFNREEGPVMDALVCADMTTGPAGERYEFEERIEEILTRYTTESPVHRAITHAKPYLAGCVERTFARLSQPM